MLSDDRISDANVDEWAVRQLSDYDAIEPGTLFEGDFALDVPDAYRVQAAVSRLRVARGDRLIGYKVGCTSPTIRAQLGIQHSIRGCLYESECYSSGSTLSRSRFANLAIEGELAIELSRRPTINDFDQRSSHSGIPQCVERVFPVIELHHHVIRGNPTAGQLIANNAIHAGFVRGAGMLSSEVVSDEEQWSLQINENDRELESCQGLALAQTIRSSLQWLVSQEPLLGEPLQAGQIVLTGSIPRLIPVPHPSRICVDTQPFGAVSAEFTE